MSKIISSLTITTLLAVGLVGCAANNDVETHNDGDTRILNQGSHENEVDTRSYNQNEILYRDRELLNEERNYYHDRLDKGDRPDHNEIEDIRNRNNSILDIGPL